MAKAVFVIGMQRNGTSILARLVGMAGGVGRQFHPCPRHDIPLMAELASDLPKEHQPWTSLLRQHVRRERARWALAKVALPFAAESFGWPVLAKGFPDAAFVFSVRDTLEAEASWRDGLPYLAAYGAQNRITTMAYFEWAVAQRNLIEGFTARSPDRCVVVRYEEMVLAPLPTLAPVWRLLGTEAPKGLEKWIHKPKHWNLSRPGASRSCAPARA
ncbi:MAG TPA: sulfotransferase [Phycisphaerae bacterium]|nr:sulfotransferase [Phycisphaerae bacterium]